MSSKRTTSKYNASASAPGSNFGDNSSKIDVDGASTAASENGSGEEQVMKHGNESPEISGENRQAIQCIMDSLQRAKPNQSVRSLITGGVGRLVASLLGFHESPGDPESKFAASLAVKLEEMEFVEFDTVLDRTVVRKSSATGISSEASTVVSASRTSDSSSIVASSQSGGESKGTEERDADSVDKVAGMLENFKSWQALGSLSM